MAQISIHPRFLEALVLTYHIYGSNSLSHLCHYQRTTRIPSRPVLHVLFFKSSASVSIMRLCRL